MKGKVMGKVQTFCSYGIKRITFLESCPVVTDRPSENSSIEMKAIE
jgi:hypothetical protein